VVETRRYKNALDALVETKREHQRLPEARPEAKIVDLQDALRRSLAEARSARRAAHTAGSGRRRAGHRPARAAS